MYTSPRRRGSEQRPPTLCQCHVCNLGLSHIPVTGSVVLLNRKVLAVAGSRRWYITIPHSAPSFFLYNSCRVSITITQHPTNFPFYLHAYGCQLSTGQWDLGAHFKLQVISGKSEFHAAQNVESWYPSAKHSQ